MTNLKTCKRIFLVLGLIFMIASILIILFRLEVPYGYTVNADHYRFSSFVIYVINYFIYGDVKIDVVPVGGSEFVAVEGAWMMPWDLLLASLVSFGGAAILSINNKKNS